MESKVGVPGKMRAKLPTCVSLRPKKQSIIRQMAHLFPGFSGMVTIIALPLIVWTISYAKRRKIKAYNLDPQGIEGAFEPLLQKYLRLAEFMIGLATGSIVLLIGSSAFHGQGGRLPWFYASPLLILAASVLTGLSFMGWLILSYEEKQHGNPHTALTYSLSETLGFSSLLFFTVGYFWLIVAVTR